jgi:hypothetical protein
MLIAWQTENPDKDMSEFSGKHISLLLLLSKEGLVKQ